MTSETSGLIQRALITRIEFLEGEIRERDQRASAGAVSMACIWDLLFPDRHGQPFDAAVVLEELRRRGIQERT